MFCFRKLFIPAVIISEILFINPACFINGDSGGGNNSVTADHSVAKLSVLESIPLSAIINTKSRLVIAYGHSSHGSQVVDGVSSLDAFMNSRGSSAGLYNGLDLRTDMGNYDSAYGAYDLNQPDYGDFEAATRLYLSTHTDINVVIWSWCAGVSHATSADITDYLERMSRLESDYPGITFVYMTGHLDGTGLTGNLHIRNEQIRRYCRENGKCLFDFADIESYDPDGVYYGDKHPTDGCNYDYDNDGVTSQTTGDPATPTGGDRNWAIVWQSFHTVDVDWYNCSAAHSQAVNANMKAYAFWWLMARIAGWGG